MMNNSENCYLKSNLTTMSLDVATTITPKQSSIGKIINRLNKSQSNLKATNKFDFKRSESNVEKLMNFNDEFKEEVTDVCSSLLNVNETTKSNRSNSMSILNKHRSISSLFDTISFSSDFNFSNKRNDRRSSTGVLRSKNLLNQIKNMNNLEVAEEKKSIYFLNLL